jgi:hypothetical protein
MQSGHLTFASEQALLSDFPWGQWRNDDTLLIQLFVTESAALLERVGQRLSQYFDQAVVVGVTAEAAIADGVTRDNAIIVSVLQFDHSHVQADVMPVQADGLQWPQDAASCEDSTRALILLASSSSAAVEPLLNRLPKQIPLVGGLASRSRDGQVAVYASGMLREAHAVLIRLQSERLQVHTGVSNK